MRCLGFTVLLLLIGFVAYGEESVILKETPASFTLANRLVSARVDKRTGNVISLKYRELDLLHHGRGYWSFAGGGSRLGSGTASAVRIDPAQNGGKRAEISCRFTYDGKPGSLPADVDVRYALGAEDQGLYVYAVWRHPPGYPAFSVGEGRYAVKLNPELFDYMAIDGNRRRLMPRGEDWDRGTQLNLKEARRLTTGRYAGQVEHKYDYSALLSETPAYGWVSTREKVGLWIVNASLESFAGGPAKVELTGHLDVNPGGQPTLLNMWLGSHYGGSSLAISRQEEWSKVIGPFLLYCNSAGDPDAMWKDALAAARKEAAAWPYSWMTEPLYPGADGRGVVKGELTLADSAGKRNVAGRIRVGLSAPDYLPSRGGAKVDWQRDGKFYQFWAEADGRGGFTIPHVRPGAYTLRAYADGVLGEFNQTGVVVKAGETLELGKLQWTPVRHGRQLWEIGVPDRSAAEFRHGDEYWKWGLYLEYAKDFPQEVDFVPGKSDWRRDWNYCQPPRIHADGSVSASTWSIRFNLAEVISGPLALRLSFCGSRAGGRVTLLVNGIEAGNTGELPENGVMHRDGIRGNWFERTITFDSSLLVAGDNVIQLKSHATLWHHGVLYDYLRLEAAEKPQHARNAAP